MYSHVYEYYRSRFRYDKDTGLMYRTGGKYDARLQNAKDHRGYIKVFIAGRSRLSHRIIWSMFYDEPAPEMIDHKNGLHADNRIENLRAATNSTNMMNRNVNCNKKYGLPKGVSKTKDNKPYCALIWQNNKRTWLGSYHTVDEAARRYNEEAIKRYGEFARLNVIAQDEVKR